MTPEEMQKMIEELQFKIENGKRTKNYGKQSKTKAFTQEEIKKLKMALSKK